MRGRRGLTFSSRANKGSETPQNQQSCSKFPNCEQQHYSHHQDKIKLQGKAMKTHALFFVLLLACMYPCLAQGTYENCCLMYNKEVKNSVKRRVVSYRVQETDGGCNIAAVVFKLKKLKTFCGDPKQQWVQNLMKRVDKM